MDNLSYFSFFSFLIFRLSSVIFLQTSYVPDEYWQSLEVAHNMTFNYGYLTWEWKHGLRSYIYPFFFSLFYQILKLLHLDNSSYLIYVPKLLQALLTAVSDQCFYLLCKQFQFHDYSIKMSIFTNWFWYYTGFRTLTNTFETALTIIALYYYPWALFTNKKKQNNSRQSEINKKTIKYLSLCGLNCFVRPTAITIWGVLVLCQFLSTSSKYYKQFFCSLLRAFFLVVPISLGIDLFFYGKLIIPAYNFIYFNIFKGISSFYGTHPFHWYVTQGLPVVLGFHYLVFLWGVVQSIKNEFRKMDFPYNKAFRVWMLVIVLNILILSNIPHKEFRFALPIMPLMMLIVVKTTSDLFKDLKKKIIIIWTLVAVLGFLIPTLLVGVLHQKGPIHLMSYLRNAVPLCQPNCFFLFLLPCHSTPLYSYLHVNVTTKFLTCDPPLSPDYYDESDEFFNNPLDWLQSNWNDKKLPSHIVFFDNVETVLSSFLGKKNYKKKTDILHTIFKGRFLGKYISVYEMS